MACRISLTNVLLIHRNGQLLIIPLLPPTPRSMVSYAHISESNCTSKAETTLGVSIKGIDYRGLGIEGREIGKRNLKTKKKKR